MVFIFWVQLKYFCIFNQNRNMTNLFQLFSKDQECRHAHDPVLLEFFGTILTPMNEKSAHGSCEIDGKITLGGCNAWEKNTEEEQNFQTLPAISRAGAKKKSSNQNIETFSLRRDDRFIWIMWHLPFSRFDLWKLNSSSKDVQNATFLLHPLIGIKLFQLIMTIQVGRNLSRKYC